MLHYNNYLHFQNKVKMGQRGNPNWAKGISGNPGGRPKHTVLTDALRRAVKQPCEDDEDLPLPRGKAKVADRIARQMCNAAANGDVNAARLIWDRLEGKPRQETDINVVHGFNANFLSALRSANDAPMALPPGGEVIDLVPELVKSQ